MRRPLRKAGLERVAGLERESEIAALYMRTVQWAGFNREIVTLPSFISKAEDYFEAWDFKETKRNGLIGNYVRTCIGGVPVNPSAATKSRYDRILREIGLHPSMPQEDVPEKLTLDFERGEVLASEVSLRSG